MLSVAVVAGKDVLVVGADAEAVGVEEGGDVGEGGDESADGEDGGGLLAFGGGLLHIAGVLEVVVLAVEVEGEEGKGEAAGRAGGAQQRGYGCHVYVYSYIVRDTRDRRQRRRRPRGAMQRWGSRPAGASVPSQPATGRASLPRAAARGWRGTPRGSRRVFSPRCGSGSAWTRVVGGDKSLESSPDLPSRLFILCYREV